MKPSTACLTVLLAGGGCGLGENSGVPPPADRIFYPGGIAVDPSSRWLYVVNSNSDLRYNAGTVVVADLVAMAEARAADWPACPPASGTTGGGACCRDRFDPQIIDCDESAFLQAGATARIGSFGGALVQQPHVVDGRAVNRLFIAVRADPSITIVDATASDEGVALRCTGTRAWDVSAPPPAGNPLCDEAWRIRAGRDDPALVLPEEPYALALDPRLGTVYVGHLRGGQVSLVDVCSPRSSRSARLVAINDGLLRPDAEGRRGITSLTIRAPIDPTNLKEETRVYATSRYSPVVAQFVMRGAAPSLCAPDSDEPAASRDLAMVNAGGFGSGAFAPAGNDIRGVVFSSGEQWAYLLHRRPAAVVRVDVRAGQSTRPTEIAEVCAGPSAIAMHDAGRGSKLFVTCFDAGQVYVVDPDPLRAVAIIEVGRGPASLVFAPGDPSFAYVAGFSDNNVSVIDLRPGGPTEYRVVQRLGFPRAVPR